MCSFYWHSIPYLAFNLFFIRSTMPPLMAIVLNVFPRYGWYSLLGYAYGKMMMNNGSKSDYCESRWMRFTISHSKVESDTIPFKIDISISELNKLTRGRFKNAYELLLLRYLKFSYANIINIFQYLGKIFFVEFQRDHLKLFAKYSRIRFGLQIVGYVLVCRSYSFVCILHHY